MGIAALVDSNIDSNNPEMKLLSCILFLSYKESSVILRKQGEMVVKRKLNHGISDRISLT